MPVRLAILGLDPIQQHWLEAIAQLATRNEIEITGAAHRTHSAAKDIVAGLKLPGGIQPVTAFDDLRTFMKESAPEVIVMDRPSHVTLDFLLACVHANVAIFSLGPPVETLAEAQALSAVLQPWTHLLNIWPRFGDSPAAAHCAQADDFVRPIRFVAADWMGVNHAVAKGAFPHGATPDFPVRSLSILAWDVLATLIRLMEMPTTVYAAIRGTVASGSTFADLSGAASLTLRFPNDAVASVSISDRLPPIAQVDAPHDPAFAGPWSRRSLMLWGNGTLNLDAHSYQFHDAEGKLIDASPAAPTKIISPTAQAVEALREFLRQVAMPPSPQRGWQHRLDETAAAMEALVVSHRTGQAESPEKFRYLRR